MNKTRNIQYVKVVISCALMVAASIGLCFYAAGVFYAPLSAQLSINLGQASSTTTIMLVFMAVSALILPGILKRVPLHMVLLAGTVLCAGASLGISFSLNLFWLYLFCALQGVGAACIGMVPATAVLNHWFNQRRPLVTSIVLSCSALAAAVLTPLLSYSIQSLGVRMSYVVQAVLILVFMLPGILWKVTLTPEQSNQVPYGAAEETKKVRRQSGGMKIVASLVAIAVLSAALIGLPQHFPSLTVSIGQPALTGASMVSLCMLGNIVFKLLGGFLSERYRSVIASGVLDLLVLASTIGLMISLNIPQSSALQILAFFFGASYALAELSLPILVGNWFGKHQYTPVYALLNCLSLVTTAVSIALIGFWYDAVKTYMWILGAAIVVEVLIALLIWLLLSDDKTGSLVQNEKTHKMIGSFKHKMQESAKQRKEKAEAQKKADALKEAASQSVQGSSSKAAVSSGNAESVKTPSQIADQAASEQNTPAKGVDIQLDPLQPRPASPDFDRNPSAPAAKPAEDQSEQTAAVSEKTETAADMPVKTETAKAAPDRADHSADKKE